MPAMRGARRWSKWGGLVLILLGGILVLWGALRQQPPGGTPALPTAPWEPLIPTAAPSPTLPLVVGSTPGVPLETNEEVPLDTPPLVILSSPPVERWRVGVSVSAGLPEDYDLHALGVGWVMNWWAYAEPPVPAGIEFAQTVRMKGGALSPPVEQLEAIAAAQPGALWLISNEPDVRWQDDVPPETYALLYHEAYHAIKAGDARAVIAAGGIAQTTPLRLAYLERALNAYEDTFGVPMPMEAWHIHNYMLREERDSWGLDIPPGFTEDSGVLYTVDDSGNLPLFREQIYTFRRWMAERGDRTLPLIVSEFGIPMPEDYGFPPERVADYLRETWTFFATATDDGIGNPADGGRLVQRWCWYSLRDPIYRTGNLLDWETGEWTALGQVWIAWAEGAR